MQGKDSGKITGQRHLRKGRFSLTNHIYHVTTVTAGRQRVLSELAPGRMVVRSLMRLEKTGRATTKAFVIMPDHLHWLLQLPDDSNLSSTVGSMKSQSGNSINRLLGRSFSAVWQRGFHDHALRRDEDIVRVARYIVANPLRAGLVSDIGDYPLWDSIWV
jgi:REP element-mobilizing transposase RayT